MALYLQFLSFIEIGPFEEGSIQHLIHKALWNRLPEREREFLLAVSIFPCFSLVQAAVLSGMSAKETETLLREKRGVRPLRQGISSSLCSQADGVCLKEIGIPWNFPKVLEFNKLVALSGHDPRCFLKHR